MLAVLVELGALLECGPVEVGERGVSLGVAVRGLRRFRSSMIALGWIFSWM